MTSFCLKARALVALLLIACALLPWAAQAQDATPVLRIETGQHGAATKNAAAGGSVLVTASEDKTARIWSLPDLRPLGVLRPPIGPGDQGKLYAVAVSPDGKWAAVGGFIAPDGQPDAILIFDLATRQIIRRLGDLPQSVFSLAVSLDGLRLAAGLGGGNGVRIWDTATWRESWSDTDYKGDIYGLSFSKDGTLAAAAITGELRLSSRDGHRIANAKVSAGKEPFRAAFSPDGRRLAIGFNNSPAVEVRDGRTLEQSATPDVAGLTDDLARVAWSEDSQDLLAAGNAWVNGSRPLFGWSQQGKGPRRSIFAEFSEGITAIVPRAGQAIAVVSFRGDIRVLAADGTATAAQSVPGQNLSRTIDVTHPTRAFPLSPDGTQLAWATWGNPNRWVQFDAARLTLSQAQALPGGLVAWQDHDASIRMTDWDISRTPKLNGRSLALGPYEASVSVAVTSSRVLIGGELSLRLFRPDSSQIWRVPVPGEVWRVNQSRDGRLAVAALDDGTIRWYRLKDGQELLALFMTEDAQRWVAWTPKGSYAASPGGETLIGWHVNRGPDKAADFFGVARFRDQFSRPDVVRRVLATLDEDEALRQADAARGTQTKADQPITKDLPPVITIVAPAPETQVPPGNLTLSYTVRSPSGKPVQRVQVRVNGSVPDNARGYDRVPTAASATDEARGSVQIPIPAEDDITISLVAETATHSSEAATLHLRGTRAAASARPRPNLIAVLVGPHDYTDRTLHLAYPGKDAADLDAVLHAQEGRLYGKVLTRVLNQTEGREAIMDALDWMKAQATSLDTVILFLAGHGANDVNNRYYFLPSNADPKRLRATAVSGLEMADALRNVPGRVIALLDTCYSGNVLGTGFRSAPDNDRLINEFSSVENGLLVMASSTGNELSAERDDLKNGLFAAALKEGFSGKADYDHTGVISLEELNLYVIKRVQELSGGRQHPNKITLNSIRDFPVAVVRP